MSRNLADRQGRAGRGGLGPRREVGVDLFDHAALGLVSLDRDQLDEARLLGQDAARHLEASLEVGNDVLGLGQLGLVEVELALGRLGLDQAELGLE